MILIVDCKVKKVKSEYITYCYFQGREKEGFFWKKDFQN
jgi:hypothetical protein